MSDEPAKQPWDDSLAAMKRSFSRLNAASAPFAGEHQGAWLMVAASVVEVAMLVAILAT